MNPTQFHQLSEEEQVKLAAHYVSNMKILKAEGVPFEDAGMRKFITTRKSRTTLWPHTGKWIMVFHSGERESGRTVKTLMIALKSQL